MATRTTLDSIRCMECPRVLDLDLPIAPATVAEIICRAAALGWRIRRTDPVGRATCPGCLGVVLP